MQTEWEIQPRSSECCSCHVGFADKAPYRTVLTFSEGGYNRRDLCPLCWQTQAEKGGTDVVSMWQGIYKAPPPKAPEPIERSAAESKLRELLPYTDPSHTAARYILAVMLERKKILIHRDTLKQDGQDVLVYEHAATGESFALTDPHLRLDQLEQVQQQVAELLGQRSESKPPEAGATSTEG